MTRAVNYAYDGTEDAEKILEHVMKRQRYSSLTRDLLAESIARIVRREITRASHGADPKARAKE